MKGKFAGIVFVALLNAGTTGWCSSLVVCIDPGHGGWDPGATGCGLVEAQVNLQVGLILRDILEADPDLEPIMTRDTDVYVSLQGRCDYANDMGADRFASLHCNAADFTASGIETYCYYNGSAASFDQRDRIQAQMTSAWPGLPDRGGKTAGFYVIRNTSMPATLSELAFIDNCALDASYLGDAGALQKAAEAHHRAIRLSLGLPEEGDPGPGTGVLRGVVFEDQGVGTADMSVRLPGALVEVTGQGTQASALASGGDASWLFSLGAGNYEVTATLDGYAPGQRECFVTQGQVKWYSVGLVPLEQGTDESPDSGVDSWDAYQDTYDTYQEDAHQEDAFLADVPYQDDAYQEDAFPADVPYQEDAHQEDAFPADVPYQEDAHQEDAFPADAFQGLDPGPANQDSWQPDPGSGTGIYTDAAPNPFEGLADAISDGCSAGPPGGGPDVGMVLLIAVLALMLSRAGRIVVFVAVAGMVLGWDARSGAQEPGAPVPFIRNARPVTPSSGFEQPVWSPDGRMLAFAGRGFRSLYVVTSEGGDAKKLATGVSSGYAPVWFGDSRALAYRAPGQRMSDVPLLSVGIDGGRAPVPRNQVPGRWALVREDRVYLRIGPVERRVSPNDDRFFGALLSPGGRFLAFQGLVTGIWVYDSRRERLWNLGPGNHPSFSADGNLVFFDRCKDDGEKLLSCSIHVALLAGGRPQPLVVRNTPNLSRHPSLSPGGDMVAFDADGAIWTAEIVLPEAWRKSLAR